MERLLKKIEKESNKKYIMYILAIISFLESIVFPVPIDIFTFSLAAINPKKWFKFGLIATIFSVLGSVFGYFLGYYLFDIFGQKMIEFYGYSEQFTYVTELFNKNTFLVIFTSAFTPIPFKVFTIAGGAIKVSLLPFISASFLGRGLRFFAEVYLAKRFGKKVTLHVMKKFNFYSIIIIILTIFYFILF